MHSSVLQIDSVGRLGRSFNNSFKPIQICRCSLTQRLLRGRATPGLEPKETSIK